MITCWNCGQANPAGAKFCVNCGKPQRASCPECGSPLPDDARFCATCGVSIGGGTAQREGVPVLTAEARKVVTVAFADLVASTALTEQLDPEEAREVVGKFYRLTQQTVERFGGQVANLLGDAVLAVFGLPVAHEDDPERAVRAGLALRDAMPALNEHLKATHRVSLDIRVGINTGEVVAASGSTFDRDFLISDAVTTAARLQQTVGPGSVVVGERTHRLTSHAIAYNERPPLPVKGKAAPLRVWEAEGALPEPAEARHMVSPFVGRHFELGLLRHLYGRTSEDGIVHLVTILGQPGIGKSRLMLEFLATMRDSEPSPRVLRGRAVAFGGQIGYHTLLDVLRAQADLLDTDSQDLVRAKLDAWLQRTVPEHGSLLRDLLLTFGSPDPEADPAQIRRRLFDAWQALLTTLAQDRPVILALEDVHWADDGTLDLVGTVSERPDVPLFIICLARADLLERRPTWGGGRTNATTIDLKPLRAQEAEQLVAALSSQGLTQEMRESIARRAEGNPLFVEELVRMLMEGSGPGLAIPDTVQAVLTARIDRLPVNERRVLQAAAVVGRTFWSPVISALTGLSQGDTDAALEGLVARELIRRHTQPAIADEHEFSFRHGLIPDVAYGMLPRAQRQRAHAEVARWLEARMGDRLEEVVEIVAEHVRFSGDEGRAARYLLRAANKAGRLYAHADAFRLFDLALEAAQHAASAPADLVAIYRGRGDVHQLMGHYTEALADFERGLEVARRAGDPALQAMMENRVGLVHHRETRLDDAAPHFQRAASLSREVGDPLTLGLSLIDLANVAWDRGRLGADDPAMAEGIALLREAGDASSLARGLNLLCMARFSAGDATGAIAAAEEALAAAREAGDKSRQATSLSYLSVVNVFWGRHRASLHHGREAIALAEQISDRRRIAFTTNFIGHALLSLGEWGEAVRLLEDSLPLIKEVARTHVPWSLFYLGMAYYELGDARRATEVLTPELGVETHHPSWREAALLGRLFLARLTGDVGALNDTLDELITVPAGIFVPDDAEALFPVGEALLEAGRVADLHHYVETRRHLLERFASLSERPSMQMLEAQLALREGRRDEAARGLEDAFRLLRDSEDVVALRRAYELRIGLLDDPEDRLALRRLLERLAATLPDDLREVFVASPRAAVLRAGDP